MRVQHRHIIYIQGYDPRGLAQYYRMFRTELRSFARLYGISANVTRPQSADGGERASWTIETKADDWQTKTDYDFLRFEDFIQKDLAQPIWRIVFHAVWIYWRLIVARHGLALLHDELALCHLHHLAASGDAGRGALRRSARLGCRERPRRNRRAPLLWYRSRDRRLHRCHGRGAEIYGEAHLRALSAVRHDLDLAVLASPAPGLGSAHRSLCAASRRCHQRQRGAGDRAGRPQLRIVPRRRAFGARAETRPFARPARSARRASDHRRQFPDRRLPQGLAGISAIICAGLRWNRRSTGSTARRART